MKVNYLNVGNKWSMSFLQEIIELNKDSIGAEKALVNSLYGDAASADSMGVRPINRLPEADCEIQDYIMEANANSIVINFTLNKPCLGAYPGIKEVVSRVEELFKKFGNGIMFTVASPFLIHHLDNIGVPLELSTIANQTSVNFIGGVLEKFDNIHKVCLPIYMNRDFESLKKLTNKFPSVVFELIVNEFCVSALNTCIFRADCYNCQSHNIYPNDLFTLCSAYRRTNKSSWLKAPFILPSWLNLYNEYTNINQFKLTGRTLPTKILMENIKRYRQGSFNGDLTELWGAPLQGQGKLEKTVNTQEIDGYPFIEHFLSTPFMCNLDLCGSDCTYCDIQYRRMGGSNE